jgi:acetoin:2,6-dichlorophenolindophenol oxidoreductase subunit beta
MPVEANETTLTETVEMTYVDALVEAQLEELKRDERVVFLGENPEVYGGVRLVEQFASRVWSTPISEGGFTGVGIGAAVTGLRPIVDLTIASFVYLASDQIINQAAKLRYMTGGQINVPIVFRVGMYYGIANAAQHSDRPYPMFLNVPGLKIVAPAVPSDAKGLLKAAIRDDDPVMCFEDVSLWSTKGDVPSDPDVLVPIGKARVCRAGNDVTLIAISGAMTAAQEAADALATEGISVELVDPRSLRPLDTQAILASVAKTGRLVIVENAHRVAGAGAEIAAVVSEEAFDSLRAPILRLAAPDVQVPFSPALEEGLYPDSNSIVSAVKRLA